MRENICSIPVNEIFEEKDGCPFCRMHDILEERVTEFIMGPAMMEPDIRIETNRLGFCREHYAQMQKKGNRLSLALMLQSHLAELEKDLFQKTIFINRAKQAEKSKKQLSTCYTCSQIEQYEKMLTVTFFKLWQKEKNFRENFKAQPVLCLSHYAGIIDAGRTALDKKNFEAFSKDATEVAQKSLRELKQDIDRFCSMFDYRNAGKDAGTAKDAIERSIKFLTGHND